MDCHMTPTWKIKQRYVYTYPCKWIMGVLTLWIPYFFKWNAIDKHTYDLSCNVQTNWSRIILVNMLMLYVNVSAICHFEAKCVRKRLNTLLAFVFLRLFCSAVPNKKWLNIRMEIETLIREWIVEKKVPQKIEAIPHERDIEHSRYMILILKYSAIILSKPSHAKHEKNNRVLEHAWENETMRTWWIEWENFMIFYFK